MSRRRTRGSIFADPNVDLRTNPDPRWVRRVEGPHWRAPDGLVYLPWIEQLSPAEAVAELHRGARVVYHRGDSDERWLTPDQLDALKQAPPPQLRPAQDRLARLEGWRAADGQVLIVAVGELSWGDVIRG